MADKRTLNKIRSYSEQAELIYDIHNHNINAMSREIYLHCHEDTIDDEEIGMEFRMATTFEKNINLLNSLGDANIFIHQHSIGGEWNDGISIFNTIQASKSPTTMLAYGHARSMSSITIQAADKRVLMKDSDFMVHYGSFYFDGTSIEAESSYATLVKSNKRMLDIYASRCVNGPFFVEKGYDENDICKYINKKMRQHSDWWLSAEEAVHYGFVDGILGTKGFEDIDKIRKTRKNRSTI